jgi:uncharacterized Tic20 family protein
LSLWGGLPLGHLVLPFWFWRKSRHLSKFNDEQGLAALNFQISLTVYLLLSLLVVYLMVGFLMIAILFCLHLVSVLWNVKRASAGEVARYPLSMAVLKAD